MARLAEVERERDEWKEQEHATLAAGRDVVAMRREVEATLRADLTATRANLTRVVEALGAIADYGRGEREGICPYGCDTPDIARRALSALSQEVQP